MSQGKKPKATLYLISLTQTVQNRPDHSITNRSVGARGRRKTDQNTRKVSKTGLVSYSRAGVDQNRSSISKVFVSVRLPVDSPLLSSGNVCFLLLEVRDTLCGHDILGASCLSLRSL